MFFGLQIFISEHKPSKSELEDLYPIIIEIFNVDPNYALCVSVYKLLHNFGVCDLRFTVQIFVVQNDTGKK